MTALAQFSRESADLLLRLTKLRRQFQVYHRHADHLFLLEAVLADVRRQIDARRGPIVATNKSGQYRETPMAWPNVSNPDVFYHILLGLNGLTLGERQLRESLEGHLPLILAHLIEVSVALYGTTRGYDPIDACVIAAHTQADLIPTQITVSGKPSPAHPPRERSL